MITEGQLLDTYAADGDRPPREVVSQYREVMEYVEQFPAEPPSVIAEQFDVPRNRVSNWKYNDTVPIPLKQLRKAHDRGWIGFDLDTSPGVHLAELSMAVYAGGSIKDDYVPSFRPKTEYGKSVMLDAIKALDLDVREREVSGNRLTEYNVSNPGALLGRVLVAMGTPRSDTKPKFRPGPPDAFLDASVDTKRRLSQLFIIERGMFQPDADTVSVLIKDRSDDYINTFADLFSSATDAGINVGYASITITADAARDLDIHELRHQ